MKTLLALLFLAMPIAAQTPIDRDWSFGVETGYLTQVGQSTDIDYRLVPTQLAFRSPRMFGKDFADGSRLSVRNRLALLGTWIAEGPESQYLGFMASPSLEYWNSAQTFAIFAGSGGGVGWIDSQGVPGGQGQDFTLNWFAQAGVQVVLTPQMSLTAAAMFQHMSNGGATDPNPGIDAVGISVGLTWRL
jgi:lipid A 3-O-deacylase